MRSLSIAWSSIAAGAVLVAGCSDGSTGAGTSESVSATTASVSATVTALPTASAPYECAQYVEKMKACIAKAPEGERAKRSEALEKTQALWDQQGKDAVGARNLAASCKAALAAVDGDASCK